MPRPRPRRAYRPPLAVRASRIAVPVALVGLAVGGVGAFAAAGTGAETAVPEPTRSAAVAREQPVSRAAERSALTTAAVSAVADRVESASRAAATAKVEEQKTQARKAAAKKDAATKDRARRNAATRARARAAHEIDVLADHAKASRTLWSTGDLNVRTDPSTDSHVVAVVSAGSKLAATSTVRNGFRLVVHRGEGRWVTDRYVSTSKPARATSGRAPAAREQSGGVSGAACSRGSGMEKGLTPDAIGVHRAVCARFPQVTSYGGLRAGGESYHATGQAVDCMISSSTVGWQLARWVRAHARQLGVSEVIYAQHIWTVQRSGEGWRPMSDRGSVTANHFDHVHVSVYGHRAA